MLTLLRKQFIHHLWQSYCQHSQQATEVKNILVQKNIHHSPLDHFAILDLPSENTGIPQLSEIFLALGYVIRGQDYLQEKQNDFRWLAAQDNINALAKNALPQVVVADFRLAEMPIEVRSIIEKYSLEAPPSPIKKIQELVNELNDSSENKNIAAELFNILSHYFTGRDWSLPTVKEFYTVQEFNELLAWTLIFGRRPNHFTLSIHLLEHFRNLEDFLSFLSNETKLPLNTDGEVIKGGVNTGIAQSSTMGSEQKIKLQDGMIDIRCDFVEFVWRYPVHQNHSSPLLWQDYFTGFVGRHANRVIESLYLNDEERVSN